MSMPEKRKYTKRNFDQEAEFQIKILEQKAREDFLINFSQFEDSMGKLVETAKLQRREDIETKVYIPAKAKSILEKWMYDHRLYCYPTKTEKQELAITTGLSVQKISNWFINSRRRMLPKMLETEGRNPINFTISRKKKKNAVTTINNEGGACSTTNQLSNYAIDEESKIIDQNSIFFGNEIESDEQQRNYDKILQEIIVPYTETDDEESKQSFQSACEYQIEQPFNRITRGILYDQETQSKCFFIVINSAK